MSSDLPYPSRPASWRLTLAFAPVRRLAAAWARRVAAVWERLVEDADERFLREARSLEDLEHRLRVLESGRRAPLRCPCR